MFLVNVEILRFVDDSFPGWVECKLVDAMGQSHIFVEKVPIVTDEVLWDDSVYPCAGTIACEVLKQWEDDQGRPCCEISTERPWSIESTEGRASFVVLASQLSKSSW